MNNPYLARLRTVRNHLRSRFKLMWKCRYAEVEHPVSIPAGCTFWAPNKFLKIGRHSSFGSSNTISTDCLIGRKAMFAANVAVVGRDAHRYDLVGVPMLDAPRGDRLLTIIGDDTWLGFGSIVVSGVTVGSYSIVAAGSVVVDDVPEFAIVAGVPARQIGWRFESKDAQTRHIDAMHAQRLVSEFATAASQFESIVARRD